MKNRAIFLDRDGVINLDTGYASKIEDFIFLDEVINSLKKFQEIGFKLFIVTNQSGIGRGYYSIEDFKKLTEYMLEVFKKENISIIEVYFCPHHPDDKCKCRKPGIFFLKQAEKDHDIDLTNSWVIGDKLTDIKMGEKAGCKTLLIKSKYNSDSSLKSFKNLKECYEEILKNM